MQLYDELKARGLIAQVTNEEEISEMINNGKERSILALIRPQTACTLATLWRSA